MRERVIVVVLSVCLSVWSVCLWHLTTDYLDVFDITCVVSMFLSVLHPYVYFGFVSTKRYYLGDNRYYTVTL